MCVCVCVCVCVWCDWTGYCSILHRPATHFPCFPGGSAGKEYDCNAVDSGSILGWLSSPEEGIGYPLQYSWASLVAQLVKNLPAMRETWVQFLGWEDPLEEGMETRYCILAWRTAWTEEPGGLQSTVTKSQTRLSDLAQHTFSQGASGACSSTPGPKPV